MRVRARERLIETCERTLVVMKREALEVLFTTWSQGRSVIDYLFSLLVGWERKGAHTCERMDGLLEKRQGGEERGTVWRDSSATGGCTRGKSILSLQRKKFMKLEHKRSHVQLAALNLRGEAGEEVGGDVVIKTSEEANKACCWSMIPASRYSHSSLDRFPLSLGIHRVSCRLPSTNHILIHEHTLTYFKTYKKDSALNDHLSLPS